MAGPAEIQAALYGHLKGLVLPTPLPLAPEGKNFDPKGKAYLRPTFMPAETAGAQLGDDADEAQTGLFQIDVFWPIDKGIAEPFQVAGAIARRFARGTRFFLDGIDLRIIQPASSLPAQQEAAWLMIPVRVPWSAVVIAA